MTASGEMPCVSVQSEMTYCSRKNGMQWPSFIKLVAIAAVPGPSSLKRNPIRRGQS